jgi:hypothetical protein
MPHPDEGLIHAWLDGELDATEAARVEALVTSDPAWTAAAAEARGLIAASARIVGTLDRVPANVVPKTAAPRRRAARQWVWRVAAVLALMAGSAVVLERGTPELTVPRSAPTPAKAPTVEPAVAPPARDVSPKPGATPPAAKKARSAAALTRADSSVRAAPVRKAEPAVAANAPASESKSSVYQKELDIQKQTDALRDKDAASALGELRANTAAAAAAAAAGAGRRAAFTTPAATPSPGYGAAAAQGQALEKTTRLPSSCFAQREPRDSAMRIIRLDAGALADSIRLERLTLRGDTLAAVHGRLTAVRVRCPQP